MYEAGTGRLLNTWQTPSERSNPAHTANSSTFYDAAGSTWQSTGSALVAQGVQYEGTESFYDAAGHLRVQDHRACIMPTNSTCSTTWMPEYNSRTAFEEYRYDALGRRVLVRTRQEWMCGLNCRNAITRTVWDGDQILYEIRSQGGTTATAAQLELDTDHFVDQTQSLYFPYGRIVYTHGIGLDDPLSLIRMNYSNVFPGPELVLPLANWQGHYDLGWYGFGPIRCTQYPPITGPTYCMKIDWPAPYMWKTMYIRSRGTSGPDSWMGSLIEQGRDESHQMYRRSRYYDPVTGRFTQEDPIGLAGGLNLYGFASGDPVNFGDPFGLCHIIKDAEAKKNCILRDPDETENQELDTLEADLAASDIPKCREAGGVLHELREQGRVKFWDTEFREREGGRLFDGTDGNVLGGDATPVPTGPVHIYSGRGSNWTPIYRRLSIRGNAVHEVGHTMYGKGQDAPSKLALDCIGVKFGK